MSGSVWVDVWEPSALPARWAELRARAEELSERAAAAGRRNLAAGAPAAGAAAAGGLDQATLAEVDRIHRAMAETADAYLASLTDVVVGRCPFTSLPVVRSVDTNTLAGPWWDHRAPVRRPRDDPATLFALTGALALDATAGVEHTEHLVAPGPAVPNVVTRLLERDDTIAVLASFAVGAHRAYVTTYFAPPGSTDLPIANEWPYDCWAGDDGWRAIDEPERIESDLTALVDAGRVLWIDPGDQRGQLHRGTAGYPYGAGETRAATGITAPQRIQFGRVW